MNLKNNPNVFFGKDKENRIRSISQIQAPFLPKDNFANSPQMLGTDYLQTVAEFYELESDQLSNLSLSPLDQLDAELGSELRLVSEKKRLGTTILEYAQTYFGLPIWGAGMAVMIHDEPIRVSSSMSSLHYGVQIQPPAVGRGEAEGFSDLDLTSLMGIVAKSSKERARSTKSRVAVINSTRKLVYRYDPDNRQPTDAHIDMEGEKHDERLILPLPDVDDSIQANTHYVVDELLFTYAVPGYGDVNWRAFVEPNTRSILLLEAFVHGATGMVFECDPLTQSGDSTITAGSSTAILNPFRANVSFDVDAPAAGDPFRLEGEFITIQDTNSPTIAPPSSVTGNFSYNANSDNFSAVNAYYHLDALFNMMEDWGFDVKGDYFSGTSFPIPVDHRGEGGQVNAHHYGNSSGSGTRRFTFGMEQTGEPVGIATDFRVVLHEFCHALLENTTGSGKFLFAHSAGDALAAIMKDPETQLTGGDRFITFPWTPISRRHDRNIADGWAWGGTNDFGGSGYNAEQILATTLFRAYRSVGGDSPNQGDREFAARYMAFLIISAIGTLTPSVNASNNEQYALALQNADIGTVYFEGHPGGAFHKVIRWAFEKQGSFQPAGAPTPVTSEGAAPAVDVYIDDGRSGEYEYRYNFWNTQDMWNRTSAGAGAGVHQTPIMGVTNFLYVKVKNRGTDTARNVKVRCFHNKPGVGLIYPNSWQTMDTPMLTAPDIPAGGEVIVGPFQWTPAIQDHECLLAAVDADGDMSNLNNITGSESIPHSRLVPFDNNIAQRNVAPVPGGGGPLRLVEALRNMRFWVTNPEPIRAQIELVPQLPAVFEKKGWKVEFQQAGEGKFSLASHEELEVSFSLIAGQEFKVEDLDGGQDIEILAYADGQLMGGMTYYVDPNMIEPANSKPHGSEKPCEDRCQDNAEKLLDCLDLCLPADKIGKVSLKKVTIDIEIKDC